MSEKKRASQGKQDFDAYDALLAADGKSAGGKQPSAGKKSGGKGAGKHCRAEIQDCQRPKRDRRGQGKGS